MTELATIAIVSIGFHIVAIVVAGIFMRRALGQKSSGRTFAVFSLGLIAQTLPSLAMFAANQTLFLVVVGWALVPIAVVAAVVWVIVSVVVG